jgi:hypothetical protein
VNLPSLQSRAATAPDPDGSAWGPPPEGFVPLRVTPARHRSPGGAARMVVAVLAVLALAAAGVALARETGLGDRAIAGRPAPVTAGPSAGAPTSSPTSSPAVAARPSTARLYRNRAGHFQARFPNRPTPTTVSLSSHDVGVHEHLLSDRSTLTIGAGIDLTDAIPVPERAAFLAGVVQGVTTTGHFTVTSETPTRFRGHDAVRARFAAATGARFDVLAAVWRPNRAYLLMAPAGRPFTQFVTSFAAVP